MFVGGIRLKIIVCVSCYSLLLAVMGLSYGYSDYDLYVSMFQSTDFFRFDGNMFDNGNAKWYGYSRNIGYAVLNKIYFMFDLSYAEFKFLSTMIFLGIILMVAFKVFKFTWEYLLFTFFYVLYPFFIDTIQVRNFFAEALLFWAMYLYVKENKYSKVEYIILIFFAITMHEVGLIYLFFLLAEYVRERNYLKYIYYGMVIIGFSLPVYVDFIKDNLEVVTMLLLSNSGEQIAGYTGTAMGYGYLIAYFYIIGSFLLLKVLLIDLDYEKDTDDYQLKYIRTTKNLFLYMCVLLPLFALGSDMNRAFRNVFLIEYTAVIYYASMARDKLKKMAAVIFLMLISGLYGAFDLYRPELQDNVFLILNNNYILDFFL